MATLSISPPLGLQVYQATRGLLGGMLYHAQVLQAAITANSVPVSAVLNLLADTVSVAQFATEVEASAPLEAAVLSFWATDQETTTTAVATLLGTMFTATTSLNAALQADFPKDGNGFLQTQSLGAGGAIVAATFTAAQLPTTGAALATWLAAVT